MKNLRAISSTERNPTKKADYNDAISYDYLVIVNERYGRGTFSFIYNKWMVIEQFKVPISKESKYNLDINRRTDFSPKELIWFEEFEP